MGHVATRHAAARPAPPSRIDWLDGVRALSALFVVLHHVWLMTYGGYPENDGPWTVGWLVYGHLGVAVFIVVSGYSLTLRPARAGLVLRGGSPGFLQHRFWRIVPPYWVALLLSSAVVVLATGTATGEALTTRDIVVHALLMQDAIGATPPNGVFWSIAIEWHIYFLFPLILVLARRYGVPAVVGGIAGFVVIVHLWGTRVPEVGMLNRFTPQFLVLFCFGMLAALLAQRTGGHEHRELARRASWASLLLLVALVSAVLVLGSARVVGAYFWVDLEVGLLVALAFLALSLGALPVLRRMLSARPLAWLGAFAFSLYLVHAPVLDLIRVGIIESSGWQGTQAFIGLLALGLPASLAASYAFFLLFERPFLHVRSWRDLRRGRPRADGAHVSPQTGASVHATTQDSRSGSSATAMSAELAMPDTAHG